MSGRALIVAPQWIGDAVMSEPLLARLAAQGDRITVAALPGVAPAYRAMPQVAEVIALPFAHGRLDLMRRWRMSRPLRRGFEAAYVLPNSLKSALLPWFAGIPSRIGYLGESRYLLLNRRLPNPAGRPPMVEFYLALAGGDVAAGGIDGKASAGAAKGSAVGPSSPVMSCAEVSRVEVSRVEMSCAEVSSGGMSSSGTTSLDNGQAPAPGGARPRLQFEPALVERVTREAGVAPGGYFAFAPGAEYGPAKRWPPGHYAALAADLWRRHRQPILLLGSPQEASACEGIAAAAPAGACRVVAGKIPLLEAMALIAGARAVVSNDSGLMHVAAACGVPQVAVFGSTSPLHTPPLNRNARVLWLKEELALDCAPCFERVCRFGHTRCLTGVGPERVERALQAALVPPPLASR